MNTEQWVALALAALAVFWAVGAYNRLVTLREAVAAAWEQVAQAQRRRAEATPALLDALRVPLAAEQGALDALLLAHARVASAAEAMNARPLQPERAGAWVAAEAAFGAAAARVAALLEGAGEAVLLEPLPALRATFREGEQRLPFARQLFNDAAVAHDEALALFPTSLLTRLFGFGPAGRL